MFKIEIITYFVSNLFRVYVMFRFSNAFFKEKKVKTKLIILSFFGYFLINSIGYMVLPNILINILTNVIPYFLVNHVYKSKLRTRLLVSVIGYSVSVFIDIGIFSVETIFKVKTIVVSSGVATSLMIFLAELLYEYYIAKPEENNELKIRQLILVIFVPVGSVFIGLKSMNYSDKNYLVESMILFLINAVVFQMYESLKKAEKEKYEKLMLEQQNISYINQINIRNESEEKIRILKHDMKNHLYKIKNLASQDKTDEINSYADSMLESVNNSIEMCDSGNYDVDSIVNLKLSKAWNEGAKIHLAVTVPKTLNIDSFDLNRILGNLFDNVLDAILKAENKIIYFKLSYEKGIVYICLRNTFNGQLKFKENNDLMSIKSNHSETHGLGLKSIKSVIEKYNGEFEYECEENVFSVYIMMYEK